MDLTPELKALIAFLAILGMGALAFLALFISQNPETWPGERGRAARALWKAKQTQKAIDIWAEADELNRRNAERLKLLPPEQQGQLTLKQ